MRLEKKRVFIMLEIPDAYDEFLDEVYGDVTIGSYTYPTSVALRLVDPIAYRIGASEFDAALDEEGW